MTQKIIKIGSSKGITIPAKQLKELNLDIGDEVAYTIKPTVKNMHSEDQAVISAAKKILKDYKQDFKNLAER